MKKIFFLVNSIADFDFGGLVDRHLPGCAVFAGSALPVDTDEFDLVVLWNYRKKIDVTGRKRNIILFHGANLPEGRGFAPIYNTIARELERYTVCGIFAADEVDQGDMIARASFAIRSNHVAADLRRWDAEISLRMTAMILQRMDHGPIRGRKQEGEPSWWQRRKPENNEIDTSRSFTALIPHLRACEDSHPAYFTLDGTRYLVSVRPQIAADFPSDLEIEFLDSAQ